MCLAVPAKIVACEGEEATVDLHGSKVRIARTLVPEATVGDWVLVHAGFAITRLEPEEAEKTFAVLRQLETTPASPAPGGPGTAESK